MAYESDEEQIEALALWWKQNGTKLIISIVVILLVLFGSRQWQTANKANEGSASDLYTSLVEISAAGSGAEATDQNLAAGIVLNTELRNDHINSVYSRFSALLIARMHVERDELDKAADQLNWILENPSLGALKSVDDELLLTARLRLARVVLAQGDAQQALSLIDAVDSASFAGAYAEVKGDAFVMLNQLDDAKAAYQLALETATNPGLLELKLEDLGE